MHDLVVDDLLELFPSFKVQRPPLPTSAAQGSRRLDGSCLPDALPHAVIWSDC